MIQQGSSLPTEVIHQSNSTHFTENTWEQIPTEVDKLTFDLLFEI